MYRCALLHVHFSFSSRSPSLNVLFCPENVLCMLEANNFRHGEKVLPFLEPIANGALYEVYEAPTTKISALCTLWMRITIVQKDFTFVQEMKYVTLRSYLRILNSVLLKFMHLTVHVVWTPINSIS